MHDKYYANLHPGRIVLEVRTQWHTPAQKKADDLRMQEVIDAQAAAIQQAHTRVREMETAMEAPASRDPGQEISPPVVMETRQAIQVAAKAKSVRPRRGPVSLQGKPGNIVVQPHGEVEVADMEVDTHQVTAPAIADYTSNKSQSGRTASCMLRRQGAVADLDLLANVALTRGSNETSQQTLPKHQLQPPGPSLGQGRPNWADATIQQTTNFHPFFDKQSYYHCQLQYKPSIPGSVMFNIFNQGKMPAPTHCVDKEELEDQPAFSVKVVGHDKFKVVASTANDIESDNEFNQLIFEEVQTGSKHKYLDRDDTDYVTSSETNKGVDKPKKSKVDRDADQESGQRSTTASKMWAKEIMPALLVWAGSLADPWTISDEELIQSLQIIILTIAPDFEDLNDICPGMVVFNIACQRLCQWHSNFGSTAITLITHFLVLDPEIGMPSLTQAQELCSKLLEGFAFLYSDQDSRKLENIFQSYFVLYLLGHAHLQPCADSPDVPKLKIRELKNTGIKGMLALTCAVLHCTLPLFKTGKLQIDAKHMSFRKAAIKIPLKVNKATGKELSAVSAFSEQNCGPHTRQYAIAIAKCDNAVLRNIVMGATMLIPYSMDCMSEGGSFQHGEDDVNDLIATLLRIIAKKVAVDDKSDSSNSGKIA
ncbi:hypothetical protein BKA82DRAFT_4016052 [Pisolithus tinctorius]|nr:hypothetical protein BKA82DRAFT_4016052 [Pisolithus tinctorius]